MDAKSTAAVQTKDESWTLGKLLDWTAKYLAERKVEFPRLDAEVLLAHAAGCKRIDLYGIRYGEEADPEVRKRYKDLIRKRLEGCPVAYLVGRKEFFGLEFEVSSAVLIPRPDSELVVMDCLELAKGVSSPRIIDIGTGSGNLAVSVAKKLAAAEVIAIDRSGDALAVARRNAEKHGVADRIRFLEGDLFAPLNADEQVEFVLSNPPYIPHDDLSKLTPGVRDYEPHVALDGGTDGFRVFERLIDESRTRLVSGGYLIVEIGAPQEKPARQRIEALAEFDLAPTIHDFSGHPRVLRARRR
jgi:release factor glutamine methyltransferase